MKIAIASGKGGTGKTTLSTNLVFLAARYYSSVRYIDCDVEAPNGHLFLKPEITQVSRVSKLVPKVDATRCMHCGKCAEICAYGAIAYVNNTVLPFHTLCHSCGGCARICRTGAISEVPFEIGQTEQGHAGPIEFVRGLLDVGQAMSPPVINAVKAVEGEVELCIIDAPPGTSCPVIASIRDCDYVVLVTEPTPFGLNDLELAVEMVRALHLDFGVVINRAGMGDDRVQHYCKAEQIEILGEIPEDRAVAEAYAQGMMACEAVPKIKMQMLELLTRISKKCANKDHERKKALYE